jgi:hypothetical protein
MLRAAVAVYYLALSGAGFYALWIVMLQNGSVEALRGVVEAGRLPDGTALGIPASLSRWRKALAVQVAFYDGVLDGRDKGHHLLMSAVHPSIQAGLTCMMLSFVAEGGPGWKTDL